MSNIIFLKPFFKPTLWANDNLQKMYHLKEKVGEAWLISVIKNCESIVKSTNEKLSDFIKHNPEFFNLSIEESKTFEYPHLIKFLDAKTPLSIQVHPNDEYAKKYHSLGKNECWYVLKTSDEPFILGTNTNKRQEILEAINSHLIEKYLNKIKLEKDDFVYIPAGLIHGIPSETMVFELQQSSDITFRLYDYERRDINGNKREIHIKESIDTMNLDLEVKIQKELTNNFYQTENFKLTKLNLKNQQEVISTNNAKHCVEVVVFDGTGYINNIPIKTGDALLISKKQQNFLVKGTVSLFISFI
ncbi:mannose-6-phosphate isomerase type 1 [Mycoplasmopsis mustelae]|uniref:Mannose-6-phosphate isomerase type 1 n=1 Tax=Mycoplasmopsis mustelae TaxID=171289 RepID=A0A4R7UFL3_9BACT|nr:type I phosphomannose isomerase catalytic subunit [Mycoplasmopsis mustelae]TDV24494.1 mannose-6-phosphate isomerase type 1 [Mycoplasmopsis mustelae]